MGLVLQGMSKIEQAVEEMKQETRHLAKRQMTWFRGDHEIRWLHPENQRQEIIESVQRFFH
jgi:tRNA dimethylallyltransferase